MSSSDSTILPYVWLAAFGLATGLTLVGAACRVLRLGQMRRVSWLIWSGLSCLVGALCFVAVNERLDEWLPDAASLLGKTGLVAVVLWASYGRWSLRAAGPMAAAKVASHAPWRLSWGLVAMNGFSAVCASGALYQSALVEEEPFEIPPPAVIRWEKIDGLNALTDGYRLVDLRRVQRSGEPQPWRVPDHLTNRVIQVADCDDRANCHGWVFTGGRFAISGADVDTILADNAYDVVEQPQPDDLIVYRGPDGAILHSGIIRSAEKDLVLVESKWGALGRYVHRPDDQTYSTSYRFYRSDRRGHLLRGMDGGFSLAIQALNARLHAPSKPEYAVLRSAAAASLQAPFGLPNLARWPLPFYRGS